MKKIVVLLGDIHFEESLNDKGCQQVSAEITRLDTHMYLDAETAESTCQTLIQHNVYEGYVIPSLYKGKIIFNC